VAVDDLLLDKESLNDINENLDDFVNRDHQDNMTEGKCVAGLKRRASENPD
jgi:hypothetical protein